MARPLKKGLDYFSIDTDISNDPKIEFLEASHGLTGFAILFKLLERIYRSGYYLKWSEREEIILSSRVKVDLTIVKVIINDCLNEGLFNKALYETFAILTSKGIQKRYLAGTIKRKDVPIFKKFILLTPEEAMKINQNVVIVDINPIKVDINPAQPELKDTLVHKVKESKVKESKVKESKGEERIAKENIGVQHEAEPAPEKNILKETQTEDLFHSEEPDTGSSLVKSGRTSKASSRAKQPKKAKLTDEEWLESLKSNPAYTGIDIERLQGKLIAWCELKGKEPTRARLLNWLNREERPLMANTKVHQQKKEEPPPWWEKERERNAARQKEIEAEQEEDQQGTENEVSIGQ